MSPSRLFILRPVATTLLMVAIMLVGIFAYRFLPLSALPQVDYPTIQVQTFYPGASPDVMTSSITAPLEVQFGQMPGLNQMSSTSSAGASVITLQFSLDLSLDVAEQEVQAAINAAGNLLPSDLPAPPIYAKVNPADAPILTLALTSKTIPLTQVEDLADTRLAQKISQLPGVGLVSISGGHRPAVRIQPNYSQHAAYGLNIDDLRTTLANANVNTPKGNFDGPSRAYTINANDQIRKPSDYNELVVAYRNGAPVKLSDVARATEGAENTKLAAWTNTDEAVIVNIQRQPGANVIEVVDRIQALLPQLRAALPSAVDVAVLPDRTTTIRASVADVEFELGLAVVLVVAVIFVFLRSPSATLIPSLSVPLSLVGTLAVMYLAGFSLNNLSLMALTIATGFVVDDAIVMIENISRYIEAGDSPLQAALKGSEQIGFTIISLTISLIAVLIPLLFMPDVVGRLFREFAITLAVTIIISAVVALTLVPMMCAKILRHRRPSASDVIRRLTRETQDVAGIALFMQPVQDLTIDATVSRSQYNFVLEDANPSEFAAWVPKLLDRLQQIPELEDVTSNFGENGLSACIQIDRATAARFGITPATADNALYDSFGQRIVSTIFTQTNQYRVILEADPSFQQSLDSFNSIYLPSSTATSGQVPLPSVAQLIQQTAPLAITYPGP